jgi:tape measure domain-containing protein
MAGRNTVEIILSASDRASGALREAFGKIEGSNSKMVSALKAGTVVVVGAMTALGGYIAKTGVEYDAMAEQSLTAWTSILGSQNKAKDTLEQLQIMGAKTPFEFEGLDKSAKLLEMAGFNGKDLFTTMTKVGDAVSAIGGNDEVLQGVSMALFQISTKGKISAQEMNQLAERGIPAWQMLADGMHLSVQQVMKLSEKGKLFAKDALPLIIDGMGNKFKGAMDKQSQSYNGLISTMKDDFKMISGELSKPLFNIMKAGLNEIVPLMDKFLGGLKNGGISGGLAAIFPPGMISTIKSISDSVMSFISAFAKSEEVKEVFKGVVEIIQVYVGYWKQRFEDLKGFLSGAWDAIKNLFTGDGNLGQTFVKIFNTVKSIALPILQDAVKFIGEKIAMVKQFWDENGAQIIQAIKNVFSIIAAIFQFIAPILLAIIKMVWESIKGVIDGALKIIMGLIKVFAGLFTGDFGKMWEGIKELFSGAIELVWNWINLLMFGRIIGGIKTFAVDAAAGFKGFWTKAWDIFKNLDKSLWDTVSGMVGKVINWFQKLYDGGSLIFATLRRDGEKIFSALWDSIKAVAGYIYDGVTGTFGKLGSGAKNIFNDLLGNAKTIFNAIKDAITNPIQTAQTLIGKAIQGIKNFFSNFKVNIPLPHFSVSEGHKTIFGKDIPYPKLDVDWYDKGGVFYGPQVIGVGEKRPEFVGALSDLKAIVKEAVSEANPTGGSAQPIQVSINFDGYEIATLLFDYFDLIQGNKVNMQSRLLGVKTN